MKVLVVMMFALSVTMVEGQDAKEIIRKMDENAQGKSSKSEMTMKIVRPTWTREVGVKGWSLGTNY
ncbi:MAG: hypothetical protein OEY51_12485, partial [Cyclobacteriaceae bacterium]|nr:hypothetical protein [Cyclobacteriaceae bacterium]